MSNRPQSPSDRSDHSDRIDIVGLFQSYNHTNHSGHSDHLTTGGPTGPTPLDPCRTESIQLNQSGPNGPTGPTQGSVVAEDVQHPDAPYGRSPGGRPLTQTGGIVSGSRPGQSLAAAIAAPPSLVARTPDAIEAVWDEAVDQAKQFQIQKRSSRET